MSSEWLAAVVSLIALIANVGTTAANIFLGERWKTRFVQEQARQDRAKALLDRYREPTTYIDLAPASTKNGLGYRCR